MKDMNGYFDREWLADKHRKRCSPSKSTGKCKFFKPQWDFTLYLLEYLQLKTGPAKCWWKCRARTLTHSRRGCGMAWPSWQTMWWFPRKVNMHLPCDPAVPVPGNYARKMKAYAHTKHINADSSFICNSSMLKIIQII